MRVQYLDLAGQKYPMVLSLSAITRIEEEFGSLEGMYEALTYRDASGLTSVILAMETTLGIFLDAGRAYASAIGMEVPPPLSCRLADVLDMDVLSTKKLIGDVISDSSEREVEAVPKSKNAGAAGEDAAASHGSALPEPRPD